MTKEELETALQTMTQQEVADHFVVHLATIKRAIKKHAIQFTKKSGGHYLYRDKPLDTSLELTPHQKDVLTGCLLGDGFILPTKIFRIKQSDKRREYVEYLHGVFSPFSTPVREDKGRKPTRVDGKVSHKAEHWGGEYVYAVSFSTRQYPIFTEVRKLWYPDDVKRLPENLKLNETILTHWYLQDGSYSKKFNMTRLSCQSFTKQEINILLDRLKIDLNITAKLGSNGEYPVIDTYQDHMKMLEAVQLSFDCFQHKLA